jgi:hypothetical protein
VPGHALGRTHGDAVGALAKDGFHRFGFHRVVQLGGRAVRIDVVDVFRVSARVVQGHAQGVDRAGAFGVWRGDVIGVGVGAIAD